MEIEKIRESCSLNSDQNCTQHFVKVYFIFLKLDDVQWFNVTSLRKL